MSLILKSRQVIDAYGTGIATMSANINLTWAWVDLVVDGALKRDASISVHFLKWEAMVGYVRSNQMGLWPALWYVPTLTAPAAIFQNIYEREKEDEQLKEKAFVFFM